MFINSKRYIAIILCSMSIFCFSSCNKKNDYTFYPCRDYITLNNYDSLKDKLSFDFNIDETSIDYDTTEYIYIESINCAEVIYTKDSEKLVFLKTNTDIPWEEWQNGLLSFIIKTNMTETTHSIPKGIVDNKILDVTLYYDQFNQFNEEEEMYLVLRWDDNYTENFILSTTAMNYDSFLDLFYMMEEI